MSRLDEDMGAIVREAVRDVLKEVLPSMLAQKCDAGGSKERYVSPETAAEMFEYTAQTIRDWVKEGRLTRYGTRGSVRVSIAELRERLSHGKAPQISDDELDEMANAAVRRMRG